MVGSLAVEEIVAPMLVEFNKTNNENALEGLCAIMADESNRMLLSNLLPKLTKPPINSVALCRLATVAEDAMSRNLTKILEALLSEELNTTVEEVIKNFITIFLIFIF